MAIGAEGIRSEVPANDLSDVFFDPSVGRKRFHQKFPMSVLPVVAMAGPSSPPFGNRAVRVRQTQLMTLSLGGSLSGSGEFKFWMRRRILGSGSGTPKDVAGFVLSA